MKFSTSSVLAALAVSTCVLPVSAQWNAEPSENLLISGDATSQDLPYSAPAADGGTFVSWLSWENANAYLKLQLLDRNGNAKFENGGMYISKNATPTWSSGLALTTDAEGNAILVYADKRNGVWQNYAYKVSPTGEMLWGDGILVADEPKESCMNPKAIVTDKGNIVIGYQSLYEGHNSLKVLKLDANGSKTWGGIIEIQGTNGLYELVAGDNDSFYHVWVMADTGSLAVNRYTANGEAAWAEPTITDNNGAIASYEPRATSDGRGGVLISWRHAMTEFITEGNFQRVDPDGKMLWEENLAFDNVPVAIAHADGNIYLAVTKGDEGNDNLFVNRYTADGEFKATSGNLKLNPAYRITVYGMVTDRNHLAIAYRNASDYNAATIEYAHLDFDCQPLATECPVSTRPGDKGFGTLSYSGNGQSVVSWTDNAGHIYAQNFTVDLSVGLHGLDAIQNESLIASYADGLITTSAAGVVSIYNMAGSRIWSGCVSDGLIRVGILRSGVYLLHSGHEVVKFIAK